MTTNAPTRALLKQNFDNLTKSEKYMLLNKTHYVPTPTTASETYYKHLYYRKILGIKKKDMPISAYFEYLPTDTTILYVEIAYLLGKEDSAMSYEFGFSIKKLPDPLFLSIFFYFVQPKHFFSMVFHNNNLFERNDVSGLVNAIFKDDKKVKLPKPKPIKYTEYEKKEAHRYELMIKPLVINKLAYCKYKKKALEIYNDIAKDTNDLNTFKQIFPKEYVKKMTDLAQEALIDAKTDDKKKKMVKILED